MGVERRSNRSRILLVTTALALWMHWRRMNIKLDAARIAVAVGHDSWPFPSQPTTGTPSSSSSFPFIREVDTQNYVTVIKHQIKW